VSGNAIYLATIWAIPVIIAITFHEAAHGFVAHLLGDDTAWRLGRVSFNPAKHIDPFGTILLPGILLLLRAPFLSPDCHHGRCDHRRHSPRYR
jgi:Zn-dependent protease